MVNVSMEYSRKVGTVDGPVPTTAAEDSRVMDFGSIFLVSSSKADSDDASPAPTTGNRPAGTNIGELVIARGFGTVIRHRDFEERSNYYDSLLVAESRAIAGKKGLHSARDPPVMHITDLMTTSTKKAKDFLPFLQRSRKLPAVVDYVLSGHRFKLLIPKETCSIAFALSGVRCPGRDEPYSQEAIALMRRKILQRDVEVEVTEVLGGGKFYVQATKDQKVSSIQRKLASLNIQEAPLIGSFNPKKGDIVLAQFSADNSWNRAMIVDTPRGPVESPTDSFEVFYIDYGNQEVVPYSKLRTIEPSLSSAPGLALAIMDSQWRNRMDNVGKWSRLDASYQVPIQF